MRIDFSEALELMNRIPRIIEKSNSKILLTLVFPDCSAARKNDADEQKEIENAKNREKRERRKKDSLQNTERWREYFDSLDDLDRDPENPEYQNNFSFWGKQVYPHG